MVFTCSITSARISSRVRSGPQPIAPETFSIDAARDAGVVEQGDRVVLTAGTSVNIPGSTNVIKVDVA